jgi:hypothetical protein
MKDLTDKRLLFLKGGLFLILGCLGGSILLLRSPNWTSAVLLVITVWAFCRLYYFAFYVIENYIDSEFRFSGLLSFLGYVIRRRQ